MPLIIAAASKSSRIRLMQVVLVKIILLLLLCCESCTCSQQQVCSGSCGVHNISHPFRLKDDPKACGDLRYNLTCEANQLMLYMEIGKFSVESINYNNFTIRLLDANLRNLHYSSYLPITNTSAIDNLEFFYSIYAPYQMYPYVDSGRGPLVSSMLYVSCPNGVDFSGGVQVDDDGAACINSSSSSLDGKSFYHFNASDKTLEILGLGDSCRVEFIYLTSWPDDETNISCTKIRDMLLYGFELSWLHSLCKEDEYLWLDKNNKHQCKQDSDWKLWQLISIAILGPEFGTDDWHRM